MQTYIALLRGINVGGHKKVPMAELRELLTKSGLENVKTYIQSGNIIFQSLEANKGKLEAVIHKSIKDYFGFGVPILVRSKDEIETILNDCPFPEEKKVSGYFIMLSEIPEKNLMDETSKEVFSGEEFIITKNCVYIFYTLGAGKAKLGINWFERKLKVNATARNYRTMVKLLSLSDI
ncbi:DUF1697 domain-containing protein [Winogradskyella sp.]|uniref:DUF1697 domain-containing protein n=1 Tax=Winogradskyella sp. TaxID=1883156 RepID=UPI0025CC68E0|nr:DUF1697 domain-containing protein [Winogradskyella sp.]